MSAWRTWSQAIKLSVSNPKNKYVAYLSVLSQISNRQGLGRKQTNEIMKTDRTHTKSAQTNNTNKHKRTNDKRDL